MDEFINISQFQVGNTIYKVYADSGDGSITFREENADFTDNTQPYPGSYLASLCVGLNQYVYQSIFSEPYAESIVSPNSVACGYNPVDPGTPFTIQSVAVTNESAYHAKDGKALVTLSGGDAPFLYSIDGGQNYNVFDGSELTGLAPGIYTFIVEDVNGLQTTGNFEIVAYPPVYGCMDATAINYDPSANLDNGTCVYQGDDNNQDNRFNLYDAVDQFRLINKAGQIFEIEMPQGWDSVVFKLERDTQYHGVNYNFSDGAIQLDFDIPAGKDILQAEYDANGNDGFMQFQFGLINPDGQFFPDVDAYIDFNTKTNDRDFFSASVKQKIFNDAIETKNEVDVTITDGYFVMPLHSKLIQKQTVVNRTFETSGINTLGNNVVDDPNPNAPAPGDSPFMVYWTFLDFTQPAEGESGYSSYINDLAPAAPLFGVTQSNPIPTSQYLFITDGGGDFTFNISFSLTFVTKVVAPLINDSRTGYWSYRWFLVINSLANVHELGGAQSGFTNSRFNNINFTTDFNKTITLNQGDRVFLYGQYVFEKINTPGGFEGTINLSYMNVNISGGTLSLPTTSASKLSFDVCQDILTNISGGIAKLVSNLLGRTDLGYAENGCAALIAYTNGYLIRGFPLADRPLIIQLKDFIEGIDANYCIGMGYELNNQNEWVYRIEQFEYFYQDVLIMTFDNVSEYKESINTDLIFNELSFGYDKYTQDLESVSTLDEFLTEHDYLTPIESYKATLTRMCKQIAAGYAIELTKRQPYSADTNVSWTYDDDNFIISTVPDQQYGYIPERLENFTASGIISPETAYNIRLAITRMLARWAKFLNSGLAFKTNSAIIQNTYTAKNGDLTSQYTGDQLCESKKQFTEAGNILKGDLANGEQSFFPEDITFKTKLSWNVIREIKRCFVNKDTQGRNNGYFGVIDGDGNTKYGYLMSMEYNPDSELVTFVLRKKYVDLNEPFDCSEYSFYTFADFEAATGLPTEIEQCLFENFA